MSARERGSIVWASALICLMACRLDPEQSPHALASERRADSRTAVALDGDGWDFWDTSSGFLFGVQHDDDRVSHTGSRWACNYASFEEGRKVHRHNWQNRLAFVDDDLVKGGRDQDHGFGMDTATLAFYGGDGSVDHWDARGEGEVHVGPRTASRPRPNEVLLGNEDAPTRYLWMCSCNVLAHGAKTASTAWGAYGHDYRDPGGFRRPEGPPVRAQSRWAPALGGLRMVCGGSSRICANKRRATDAIWHLKNAVGVDVADSFLLGMRVDDDEVPLCLTRSSHRLPAGFAEHELFDPDFDARASPNGKGARFFLEYPRLIKRRPRPNDQQLRFELQVWSLEHREPPPRLHFDGKIYDLTQAGRFLRSVETPGSGLGVVVDQDSGAVYYRGRRTAPVEYEDGAWQRHRRAARKHLDDLLHQLGVPRDQVSMNEGVELLIDEYERANSQEWSARYLKTLMYSYRLRVQAPVRVEGRGLLAEILLNGDGTLYSAYAFLPEIGDEIRTEAIDLEDAGRHASSLQDLASRDAGLVAEEFDSIYRAPEFEVVYQAFSGNCATSELIPAVAARYFPMAGAPEEYGPITLLVDGASLMSEEPTLLVCPDCRDQFSRASF